MKIIIFIIITLFATFSMSWGQKAYENITYTGNLNGRKISFLLADGYLGASSITLQSNGNTKIKFDPEFGDAGKKGTLKFLHYLKPNKISKHYFILKGIRGNLKEIPDRISGIYSNGEEQFKITLKK